MWGNGEKEESSGRQTHCWRRQKTNGYQTWGKKIWSIEAHKPPIGHDKSTNNWKLGNKHKWHGSIMSLKLYN